MTIKYECDNCGQEVYGPEAIGEGVVVYQGDHAHMGKAYVFEDADTPLTLNISITDRENGEQFCLACMWQALGRMMERYAPKVVEPQTPTFMEQANALAEQFMEEEAHRVQEMDALRKFPKSVGDSLNEETPTGATDTDPQLHELYAEGMLPTPGADERTDDADDPGLDPYHKNPVPNTEDRPGWKFHSTANGI